MVFKFVTAFSVEEVPLWLESLVTSLVWGAVVSIVVESGDSDKELSELILEETVSTVLAQPVVKTDIAIAIQKIFIVAFIIFFIKIHRFLKIPNSIVYSIGFYPFCFYGLIIAVEYVSFVIET